MLKIAISYLRYSSASQADGDSIRRQDSLAESWCRRNGHQLDKGRRYVDRQCSAFRGRNAELGYLRAILDDIEAGRILRGEVLLIENMDRLSRAKPVPAVNLMTSILLAGVRIVQLSPDELELDEDSDLFALLRGQLSQARGHDESSMKSARLLQTFAEKRRAARESGKVMTSCVPLWIDATGETMKLRPDRAALVRQMFEWSIQGMGTALIVRKLVADKVPAWGRSRVWNKMYVGRIIRGRAAIGEHQPTREGKPDGEPIPNYYPAVVSESVWLQAQAGMDRRKSFPGRVSEKVANLFTGLVWEATSQTRMYATVRECGFGPYKRKYRVLLPSSFLASGAKYRQFMYDVFQRELLRKFCEIQPGDILGEPEDSEVKALTTERTAVDARLRAIQEELASDEEPVPTLAKAARTLTDRLRDLNQRIKVAEQRDANPATSMWAEAQTLADAAESLETRMRLRTLLREIVESIWVLIVPKRSRRLAVIQVYFAAGKRRDYLIDYRGGKGPRPAIVETHCTTWETDEKGPGRDFDLRKKEDAAILESFLARMME